MSKTGAPRTADLYDEAAFLYAKAFPDPRFRGLEWRWLSARLGAARPSVVLDIGCGTGALLRALYGRIGRGIGVDVSRRMIGSAEEQSNRYPRLSFLCTDGRLLPVSSGSVDLVVSTFSYRYLDWDTAPQEIMRILTPGGRFLCIDVALSTLSLRDVPALLATMASAALGRFRFPGIWRSLGILKASGAWNAVLADDPMTTLASFRKSARDSYGVRVEVLSVSRRLKTAAFEVVSSPCAPQD